MKLKPLRDYIVVTRDDAEITTPGGVLMIEKFADQPQGGKVIAAGKGTYLSDGTLRPLDVKPGDRILFGKHAGTEVEVGDEKYLMMKEQDVLARVAA